MKLGQGQTSVKYLGRFCPGCFATLKGLGSVAIGKRYMYVRAKERASPVTLVGKKKMREENILYVRA